MSLFLTDACKRWLGSLVIASIESALAQTDAHCPEPSASLSDEERASVTTELGSFVTLKIQDMLRGCIGSIIGVEPLYKNVWRMARQAAFSDPRFAPLSKNEWPRCSAEISVLSKPTVCPDLKAIEIGKHGLILQYGGRSGVFLPQVPIEQGWNLSQYLDHLCLKAGVPVGSYKKEGAVLYYYDATVFPVER